MRLPFACLLALSLAACATPMRLNPTTRSPSTDAFVKVELDQNGNALLTIKVEHLPPPERLGQGLTTYVVWISTPDGSATVNGGMLKVGDSQSGSMQTTTPFREFLIRVTAEESGDVLAPGPHVVIEGAAKRG